MITGCHVYVNQLTYGEFVCVMSFSMLYPAERNFGKGICESSGFESDRAKLDRLILPDVR